MKNLLIGKRKIPQNESIFNFNLVLLSILLVFLYYNVFSYNYINIISKDYLYMGFIYRETSLFSNVLCLLFLMAPISFIPTKFIYPSDVLFHLIFIIVYIPSVIIINYVSGGFSLNIFILISNIFLSFLLMFLASRIKIPRPNIGSMTARASMTTLLILAVLGALVLISQMGISSSLPNFRDVYGQRALYMEAYEKNESLPWVVGITTQIVAPLILAYGFSKKNLFYISFGILIQMYIFSVTGLKQTVISIVYIFLLYIVLNYFKKFILPVFLIGTIFLFAFGIALNNFLDYEFFNGFFNRRTFMLQGLLTNVYYNFAEGREFLLWSHSVLSPFFKYAIVENPELLIGRTYFFENTHANAAIWADGYMNAGILGLYIVCGITGLFLALLNSVSRHSDPKIIASGLAMLFMLICQTGITKVVGVHGGLFAIFLLMITRFPQQSSNIRNRPKSFYGSRASRPVTNTGHMHE